MKDQSPKHFDGHFLAAWCCALVLLTCCASLGTTPKDPLPADLLAQWQRIKAESPDSGKVGELVAEGERIMQRLQEIEELRHNPKSASAAGFNQRAEQLQDRFRDLLRRLEMARVAQLPNVELEAMRARYGQEQQRLQSETRALEDTIVARGELFLATYKQNVNFTQFLSKQEMIVDFLYRLAEIYYRRGEEEFFTTNDISSFKPALEKYQRVIDEFPASEYVDDALYNIAYVKNSSRSPDDQQEAIKLYKTLIEKYSSSPFVAESYWRVGEYYFYQDPPQIENAVKYYAALLDHPETPWYARGLYKIGWCHFRNNDYPQAVEYFTRTVEVSLDSAEISQDVLFTSMQDEALEYISVCFATEDSLASGDKVAVAIAFVQANSVRRASYGRRILEYLGDIYKFQIGKYPQAVEAYRATLELYPLAEQSPWVQEKIINCYAANLRDYANAYDEKNALFERYRAGSAWDQAHPDSALRADADVIIEKYYFQNISEAIGRAMQNGDVALFAKSVQMSRDYLQFFPQGPNAYTVNFNMAVMLEQNVKDSEQAFVEYIKVSRDYPDDRHRKESAVNAAIIAQRLINQQGLPADSMQGQPVGDAEQKFIAAAENYLTLFPQGEEAEVFLLNAGSIYYNHGLYPDSRKYYEKMLAQFPSGSRRGDAYRFIMNGYFAEQNYADAERVAKEIQAAGWSGSGTTPTTELVANAKTRQAESAFLTAAGLKAADHFLESAAEFKRTALESPDYPQADKALFESGLAYQEAKSWKEAEEVYLLLAERYPQSDLADKALFNTAYNSQSELGNKAFAAATFERLASQYPQSPLAQDALRNSSINYVEASDWTGAIRANTAYLQAFPNASDANLYLFENAGHYLKLGDEVAAEQIYADYARRFPNDPRTIRAHWERGKYLSQRDGYLPQDKGRQSEAYVEFGAGIQAHRHLVAAGQLGEEVYGSRCLLEVIRADFTAYEALQFAPAKEMEANKKTKLARRDALLAELEELNRLGKDEMLEGCYSVGRVEEDLSKSFERRELPPQGSAEENILAREVANQDAIEIAARAMAAYRKAAEEIEKAGDVLKSKVAELQAHREQLGAWVTEAQKSVPQPQPLPDSTATLADLNHGLQEVRAAIQNAETWGRQAREKVPELALHNAEIKHATVRAFFALPDAGKTEELRVAYRAAVLSEFAAPRGAEVMRLYHSALVEAVSSADSAQWRKKALDGIQELAATLEGEFRALSERALGAYAQNFSDYQSLLAQGEGATTRGGSQAADIAEKLVFYSGQSFEFAKGALAAQGALIGAAEEGEAIPPEATQRLAVASLMEVFRLNQRYTALSAEANAAKTSAAERKAESVIWEDASMTFEDCAYNFNEHQETLLNAALEFNKNHGADKALALRLSWALVSLNREVYLPLLAEYGEEVWVRSDETFRVNHQYCTDWASLNCPEDGWMAPTILPHNDNYSAELAESKALWLAPQPAAGSPDSLRRNEQHCDSIYVRKAFDIAQEPVAGDLWITAHGGFALQVNGDLVGAVEPSQELNSPVHYEIAEYLKSGQNVISILAVDPDSVNEGIMVALRYKALPLQTYGGP